MSDFQAYKKMLREWACEQEPVFIMGPERSGTSLLFQQVSNHPAFCDFSHATVETFCFVRPWQLLDVAGPDNYEMRVYLGQGKLKAYQQTIVPLIERNKMLTKQGMPLSYLNKNKRKEIWFERRYKHVLRAFFYHSWTNLGEKRLVEKTPAHIRCATEIFETFPKAKLLVCTRDPSEIIASHKKRYKKEVELGKAADDPSIAWLSHSTEEYLRYFLSIDKSIQSLKSNHADNVKVVPYGLLTNAPEETVQNVYSFIGAEQFALSNVDKKRNEQAWDPLLNRAPQKNNIVIERFLNKSEIELVDKYKRGYSDFWY
ncbi:sulfotransferase family protein [Paraglaciecola sp. 2405UD69-4]|uniref:sulfotransferase family protein n=1 Tax=Paraglaciecola sp. 2405UD69-4 TaxID=3391836 RepID=UPI0039C97D9C